MVLKVIQEAVVTVPKMEAKRAVVASKVAVRSKRNRK